MSAQTSAATRAQRRRWVVPPAPLFQDERYEVPHILDEVADPRVAVLLWQTVRDVELWATAEPEDRKGIFSTLARRVRFFRLDRIEPEAAARAPLTTLANLLGAPEAVQASDLCLACLGVAEWAGERGLLRTALLYGQAAALAGPDAAQPALTVGSMARRRADYVRAEAWYRRAIGLARRVGDWKTYGLAYVGLANLYLQTGDYPSARRQLLKALRAARRHALWFIRAAALHDLFIIAAQSQGPADAEAYARRAFKAYGRRHPRLIALAHDVGWFWMLQGHFGRALPLFQALVRNIADRSSRLLATSSVARAAGGVGDERAFVAAWDDAWTQVDAAAEAERVPEALINLAHGAVSLGDRERARLAAVRAAAVAGARREAQAQIEAEAILDSLRGADLPRPRVPEPVDAETERTGDTFAQEFAAVLNGRR